MFFNWLISTLFHSSILIEFEANSSELYYTLHFSYFQAYLILHGLHLSSLIDLFSAKVHKNCEDNLLLEYTPLTLSISHSFLDVRLQ